MESTAKMHSFCRLGVLGTTYANNRTKMYKCKYAITGKSSQQNKEGRRKCCHHSFFQFLVLIIFLFPPKKIPQRLHQAGCIITILVRNIFVSPSNCQVAVNCRRNGGGKRLSNLDCWFSGWGILLLLLLLYRVIRFYIPVLC